MSLWPLLRARGGLIDTVPSKQQGAAHVYLWCPTR